MLAFFIILQCILLIFMLFHDWVSVRPFNDIDALKQVDSHFYRLLGSVINGTLVLIPLILTCIFFHREHIPYLAIFFVFAFYLLLTIGTIFSWWVPYIFGSSEAHKQQFIKFKNTHYFLPERGDNIVPNTLHVILHLLVWACLAISIYFLATH